MGAGDADAGLRLVHDELVRIEKHWTMQLQNQQARIATVLSLNTGALTFLGGASLITKVHGRSFDLLVAALGLLTAAVVVGAAALVPWTPITGRSGWLNADDVWRRYEREPGSSAWLREVCDSLAIDQRDANHPRRLTWRRRALWSELALMCVALAAISVTVAYM